MLLNVEEFWDKFRMKRSSCLVSQNSTVLSKVTAEEYIHLLVLLVVNTKLTFSFSLALFSVSYALFVIKLQLKW